MAATRTILRGISALAVLAALTLGLPWLLFKVAGSPIPDTIPTWDQTWTALTSRDDGTLLLGVLKYVGWAGWAIFTVSLVADLIARVRGISVPRLGPQQQLASGLVSAVVAITVAVPSVGTAAVAAPVHGTQQSVTATALAEHPAADRSMSWQASLAATTSAAQPAAAASRDQSTQFTRYTVRRGDCLWDIAWNELGDPERWPELWHASRHLRQPGGQRITDPDHIEPGWTIHIPTTEHPADQPEPRTPKSTAGSRGPQVVTPLDLPTAGATRDVPAHPAVTTPLSIDPASAGVRATGVQDRALDRWAAAVAGQDDPGTRGAWRARISGLPTG